MREDDIHKTTLKKAAMIKALEGELGIVSKAAKKAKIDRGTHYKWIREDNEYREAVEELNDVVLDFAEEHLYDRIKDGSDACTLFLLKCRGKKRGYIEREEVKEDTKDNIIMVGFKKE